MINKNRKVRSPWTWVPSLYFFQGIPYSIVMVTSGLMYKTMGVSIASFAFWTSLLYLPWTIKPLWSPYIDVVSTKRKWVIYTQLLLGIAFIATGIVMPLPFYYPLSLILLAIIAFSSASHDIAADGFYMYALDQHNQAFFVGIRSTFYRLAKLTALGLIPVVAGLVLVNTGLKPVNFRAESVMPEEYKQYDPKDIKITSTGDKPQLLIFPENLQIPVYKAGVSDIDSAALYIALSAPPQQDETVVVNVVRKSGSKDIDISKKQTGRFEFNSDNWDEPVALSLKVNHNLTSAESAGFVITAGNVAFSWVIAFGVLGVVLLLLGLYNMVMMPYPAENATQTKIGWDVYKDVFVSFFTKPGTIPALLFFLLYRFGEAQLFKIATPFLVDSRTAGGIGLSTAQYGLVYGTIGVICLTLGGIIGGITASKYGLKRLIWLMALGMNIPIGVYVYLAYFQPMPTDPLISVAIAIEQFGYGFGFTGYMLYMLHFVNESRYKTAEYAIATSLMAFGMMLPGMISGSVREMLGYQHFFIYVMICAIPGLIAIKFLRIDPLFGIKKE
jgi:MFS transporter, PAT family, beta-lactamase induction signal transducer AmpG